MRYFQKVKVYFAIFSIFGVDMKERIKALAKDKSISINKLEKDLGFAQGYISKLDKSKPNSEKIRKIADYFGVSVDYLMTGETVQLKKYSDVDAELLSRIARDKELQKVFKAYLSLPDDKKSVISDMIFMYTDKLNK